MTLLLPDRPDPPDKGSNSSRSQRSTSHRSTPSIRDGSRSGRRSSRSSFSHDKNKNTQQDAEHVPYRLFRGWDWSGLKQDEGTPSARDKSRSGRRKSRSISPKDNHMVTQQDTQDHASPNRDRSRRAGSSPNGLGHKPRRTSAGSTGRSSAAPLERGRSHRRINIEKLDRTPPLKACPSAKPHRFPSRSSRRSYRTSEGGPRGQSIVPHEHGRVPRDTRKFDRRRSPLPPFRPDPQRSRSHMSRKTSKASEPIDTEIPPPSSPSRQRRRSSLASRRSDKIVPPDMETSPAVPAPERPSSQHRTSSRLSHRSKDLVSPERTALPVNSPPGPSPSQQRGTSRLSRRSENIVLPEATFPDIAPHEPPFSQRLSSSRSSRKSKDLVSPERPALPASPPPEPSPIQQRETSISSHRSENTTPPDMAMLPPKLQPERPSGHRGRRPRSFHRSEDLVHAERETSPTAAHNRSPTRGPNRIRSRSRPSVYLREDWEEPSASRNPRQYGKVYHETYPPVSRKTAFAKALPKILEEKDYTGSHVAELGWRFHGDSEAIQVKMFASSYCARNETPLREKTREEKKEIYQDRVNDPNRRWVKSLCRDPKTGKHNPEWTP